MGRHRIGSIMAAGLGAAVSAVHRSTRLDSRSAVPCCVCRRYVLLRAATRVGRIVASTGDRVVAGGREEQLCSTSGCFRRVSSEGSGQANRWVTPHCGAMAGINVPPAHARAWLPRLESPLYESI